MAGEVIGRIVHYVSYGTPGGEYSSECRAAIITEVGLPGEPADGGDFVGLCVLNPTGQFFNRGVRHDPGTGRHVANSRLCDQQDVEGGTWHWPVRV